MEAEGAKGVGKASAGPSAVHAAPTGAASQLCPGRTCPGGGGGHRGGCPTVMPPGESLPGVPTPFRLRETSGLAVLRSHRAHRASGVRKIDFTAR